MHLRPRDAGLNLYDGLHLPSDNPIMNGRVRSAWRDVRVPHPSQRTGGERRPLTVVVAHDDVDAQKEDRLGQTELQLSPGIQAGTRDVGPVLLTRVPNVDQGEGRAARKQLSQLTGGDQVGHGTGLASITRQFTPCPAHPGGTPHGYGRCESCPSKVTFE